MSHSDHLATIGRFFSKSRPRGRYIPGVAAATSVLTVASLLALLPGSVITSWTFTGDVTPLVVAGGAAQPIVGFFQYGIVRVYVPLVALLFVVGGELASATLGRLGTVVAIAGGIGAGSQLIVLSGCGCGYGTAGTTGSLFEQAIAAGLL